MTIIFDGPPGTKLGEGEVDGMTSCSPPTTSQSGNCRTIRMKTTS